MKKCILILILLSTSLYHQCKINSIDFFYSDLIKWSSIHQNFTEQELIEAFPQYEDIIKSNIKNDQIFIVTSKNDELSIRYSISINDLIKYQEYKQYTTNNKISAWAFILSFFAIIFAGISAIYSLKNYRAEKNIRKSFLAPSDSPGSWKDYNGEKRLLSIQLKNFGKNPAIDISARAYVISLLISEKDNKIDKDYNTIFKSEKLHCSNPIAPNGTFRSLIVIDKIDSILIPGFKY